MTTVGLSVLIVWIGSNFSMLQIPLTTGSIFRAKVRDAQESLQRFRARLPAGVEVITAWENDICMMLEENTTQMTEGYQGTVDKRSIERHRRRHERRELSEADTVIPNVQCAVALDFAEDTVRGAGEVMGCLEHMRIFLWTGIEKMKRYLCQCLKPGQAVASLASRSPPL